MVIEMRVTTCTPDTRSSRLIVIITRIRNGRETDCREIVMTCGRSVVWSDAIGDGDIEKIIDNVKLS